MIVIWRCGGTSYLIKGDGYSIPIIIDNLLYKMSYVVILKTV